jgi:hypothetical protein
MENEKWYLSDEVFQKIKYKPINKNPIDLIKYLSVHNVIVLPHNLNLSFNLKENES